MAGGCELGCEPSTAFIYGRGGQILLGEIKDATQIVWDRRLDQVSEASVDIVTAGPDCCELLGDTRTWGHELVIYRGDQRCWEGPITLLEYGPDSIHLEARDVSAWLGRRVVHNALSFTGTDLATIAAAIITDALSPDDPNVLPYLLTVPAGVTGDRVIAADSKYADDELRELLRTGLDMTVIGRRIVLGPEASFGGLLGLGAGAFAGQVTVTEDGALATTRAIVKGRGVSATSGGIDAFYGLLETLVSEDTILDAVSAQANADRRVMEGMPVPLYLEVPDGSTLDPRTPLCINELVPGATALVSNGDTCRPLTQTQRLSQVKVSSTAEGDTVQVSFAPLGGDEDSA